MCDPRLLSATGALYIVADGRWLAEGAREARLACGYCNLLWTIGIGQLGLAQSTDISPTCK
jgi:hypothetical protein